MSSISINSASASPINNNIKQQPRKLSLLRRAGSAIKRLFRRSHKSNGPITYIPLIDMPAVSPQQSLQSELQLSTVDLSLLKAAPSKPDHYQTAQNTTSVIFAELNKLVIIYDGLPESVLKEEQEQIFEAEFHRISAFADFIDSELIEEEFARIAAVYESYLCEEQVSSSFVEQESSISLGHRLIGSLKRFLRLLADKVTAPYRASRNRLSLLYYTYLYREYRYLGFRAMYLTHLTTGMRFRA